MVLQPDLKRENTQCHLDGMKTWLGNGNFQVYQ